MAPFKRIYSKIIQLLFIALPPVFSFGIDLPESIASHPVALQSSSSKFSLHFSSSKQTLCGALIKYYASEADNSILEKMLSGEACISGDLVDCIFSTMTPDRALKFYKYSKPQLGQEKMCFLRLCWQDKIFRFSKLLTVRLTWEDALDGPITQLKIDADLTDKQIQCLESNTILSSLCLDNYHLSPEVSVQVLDVLKKNTAVTALTVCDKLTVLKIIEFPKILEKNNSLRTLNLTKCRINGVQGIILAIALRHNMFLTTLILDYNRIDTAGIIALAEMLETNRSLTTLSLVRNEIKLASAKALAEALKINDTLKSLNLSEGKIGFESVLALTQALPVNSSLTLLNLSLNYINEEAIMAMAETLESNKSLKILVLSRRYVSPKYPEHSCSV